MTELSGRIAALSDKRKALLAQRLRGEVKTAPAAPSIPRRPGGGPARLSFAQERLWFLDRLEPGSAAYNIPGAFRVEGDLDREALARSLDEVVRRHEVLRTTFAAGEEGPVQSVLPPARVPFPLIDLAELPEERREEAVREIVSREARRPFDLSRGPLLRVKLLRLAPRRHVALFVLHHAVSDGWSLELLIREIGALYPAFREGRAPELPELPVQYADFAEWQRARLSGEALEAQIAYWRERLRGAPPFLELPADRPRTAVGASRGAASFPWRIGPGVEPALRALGRARGATPFMVLLAAFYALLHRYTGQADLVVGATVAGRQGRETESLIGLFINTLAMRAALGGDTRFPDLLARVRESVIEDYAHQDLPFEKLVEALRPERSLHHTPVFQVLFSLHAPTAVLELPGLRLERFETDSLPSKLDLLLAVDDKAQGLEPFVSYRPELFDRATVERMMAHFAELLAGIAADPERPVAELPLLTAAERHRLLHEWSETAPAAVPDRLVHEIFEARAEESPEAEALVCEDLRLTYGELNRRANRLAHHLRSLGVEPEVRVGICAERSSDMILGLLGVLKAGGAYVPLDPTYPEARLSFMLEEAGAPVLLVQEHLAGLLPAEGRQRVLLGGDLPAGRDGNPPRLAGPANLAYVLFTSGSTGRPKGVAVEHRQLVHYTGAVLERLALAGSASFATVSTLSADLGNTSVFPALLTGGTLHVLTAERASDPRALAESFARDPVDCLKIVPSHHKALRATSQPAGVLPHRRLVFGGEPLSWAEVDEMRALAPGLAVLNHYGPTESTVGVLTHRVTDGVPRRGATVPLGRPLANVRIRVVDAWGQPVAAGVAGELLLGGAGLARGYLDRPDLTAAKFVPDPFGREPGARLYRTGDLVRHLPDGALEFLGRIDQQVKIRGFRVEPGEVEAALTALPGVAAAAVLPREHGPGDRRLVAFLVAAAGTDLSPESVRDALRGSLPDALVPAVIVFLEALPLNPNGKVDRQALARLAPEGSADSARPWEPPRTAAERALAGIWADLLRVERVGIHDSFFELGGHSLLATRLVSRVREELGVDVPLRSVFEAPSIARFAERLGESPAAARPPIAPSPLREVTNRFPCSFAQQRLWLLQELDPESAAYNVPSALRLAGRADVPAFARALSEVVRRHEVLRSTFEAAGEGPVQAVGPAAPVPLPEIDLSGLPEARREAELAQRAGEEARRPFDLRRGPVLRAVLFHLGPEDHAFLLSVHHIVSDAWSRSLLVRELAALYTAFLRGLPSPLPELPLQYADFAAWQRSWLAGEALEEQLTHWRERLAGVPRVLDLPADRPRPPVRTYRGAVERFAFPGELLEAVRELGKKTGTTPFMVLLAAFDAVLHRYTGQERLLVATPVAGRTHREVEDLVGFFINTLVLSADLSGDPSFADFLARTRETALDAFAHQDLPFDRLVEDLQPERDLSRPPLAQVLFALQNVPRESLELPGLTATPVELDTDTAKLDLSLSFLEQEGELAGAVEYDSGLFDAARIRRLAGHLRELLEGAVASPKQRLSELPLLSMAERRQLLAWNATEVSYPREILLHQLFEAQAERSPDAVAVRFEEQSLTYRELDLYANRLAGWLRANGVGPEAVVGVLLDRSLEMVVALYAVLKAGGAYLPLDPSYPRERLSFFVEDAAPRVVLTTSSLAELLPPGTRAVRLDTDTLTTEEGGPPETLTRPDGLAYAIYTSGSTGRPKGAMNAHRGIVNRILWMQEAYGLGPGDRVLQKTPFSFDVSVWEFFWPLAVGARLVLARPGGHRDPSYLVDVIEREGITTLHFVPSMLRSFLDASGLERCASLKRVIASGEELPADLATRLFDRLGWAELHNLYGPTEAAVDVTAWPCRRDTVGAGVPIGRPIANLRIHLADWNGQPVPAGVPGELLIGGTGVGRGYLARPALTAERFVPDPWSPEPGARLYRTGDLARYRDDGAIDYLGRLDHQVKIRGFRVELGEIEAALAALPGVGAAVVLAREYGPGDRRLVAYLVPEDGAELSPEALREALRGTLPEALLPAAFVSLPALPLSPNGKVDRRALSAIAPDGSAVPERPYTPPGSPVEETLAEIWAGLLKVERVGIHDNFFDLGGHSLLAHQLTVRVRESFGVDLPLRSLFEAPTIARFALVVLAQERSSSQVSSLAPSPLKGTADRFPCSFSQQRLWFLHQMEPGSPAYNVPSALRLEGLLDLAALGRALTEVVRRHEVLRSTFEEGEEGPVQVVAPAAAVPLPRVDLASLPGEAREAELSRLVAEEARRPFDLARGPVLRAAVLRLGGEDHVLFVSLHHIVSDAWSKGVFVRELSALYGAFSRGLPSPLPELPVQYADFADWQRRWLQGDVLAAQVEHWRQRLAGAPPILALPTDRPRPAVQSSRGGSRPFALPASTAQPLEDLARREGCTLFAVLLAAFQALLVRFSGQEDVSVGFPSAGRRHRETESLIGFFVNTLVLRSDLSGDPPFRALLGKVRETLLDDQANQDVPFERLVDELRIERTLSHTPLFQVMLALQNAPRAEAPLGDLRLSPLDVSTGASKFDLTLVLSAGEEGLAGVLEYSADLFDAATADRLLGCFRRLLDGVAADPGRRIRSYPLLSPEERSHLLSWNTGAARRPVETTLHQLFAAQAARSPEAAAVVCGGERLSYGELDALVDAWASRLRELGVGPEARVGLCVERSVAMVVGILAILKAGGAYVPLDPAYPEDRLRYLFADSGIRVLLTQSALRDRLPEHGAVVIDLDGPPETGGTAPPAAADPACLAYVIYTSGSTGRPKGVGVTHANVVRLFASTEGLFDFGPGDVWTLFHSHAFDFSVWEIWGALLYGGTLVVVPYWVSRSPADFRRLLAEERVTVLSQTPSAFRQLIEADEAAGGEGIALRYVVFGGEALDLPGLRPWLARHGDRQPRLINMYGITETTVHVTFRPVTAADVERGAGSVIGRALPDLSLAVLDRNREPAPLGVPGEMVVGGAGVARGYLGRPELTAERFVPDPFGREPGGRLYRSGDLARYLPDGDLEYLGRIDHQVKIRGFRIELGEIEAALSEHPAVRQGLVLAREEGPGDRRLIAWLVFGAEPFPEVDELRAFLRKRLPEHMIPAAFVPLPAFPLTAHGKIDRAALPAPERGRGDLAGDFAPPRTPGEKALAGIWAEVLKLDRVGVDDNFFALGGDSILSIRVRSLAAERGLHFELQDLFRYQTLAELAGAAGQEGEEALALSPFDLVAPEDRERLPEGVEDAYPLSALQSGMLFHSESGDGRAAYHNVSRFLLRGRLDPAAFERAVARLLARHPVLRTCFDLTRYRRPLQLVHREVPAPVEVADLRSLSPEERARESRRRFASELAHRFAWDRPPLLRFWVHLLDGETFELGMAEHHAILDGWSAASLLSELFALVLEEQGEGEPLPPPPAAAFRDFVALEQRTLESGESRDFWSALLAGRTSSRLPRWPGAAGGGRAPAVTRTLPADALEPVASAAETPVKSVLLAVHLRVLAALSGSRDVLTGLVVNGRPETADGDRVLGLFLNTVPFRLPALAGSWTDLAREVFRREREMMPHRRFPLAELQRGPGGGEPLFEVSFNYVHFHVLESTRGLEVLDVDTVAETNFPLAVSFSRGLGGAGIELALQYDTHLFPRAQVESFAGLYLRAFEALARDPGADAAGVVLLSDAERHQILREWNDSAVPFPEDRTIHGLIEDQVDRAPGAVAVVAEEGELRYRELDILANRLAHRLRALGVGPESRVGICAERSLELVVGLLGILKAGGAYVPLDPEYPQERLAYMVEDSGLQVLLTQRRLAGRLAFPGVRLLELEEEGGRDGRPGIGVDPDQAAYCIYTSGSTGRPKGVVVSHRSLANRLAFVQRTYPLTPEDRILQKAAFGFDVSVWEFFGPLAAGARLVLARPGGHRDPAYLVRFLAEQGITFVHFVPSMFKMLLAEPGLERCTGLRSVLLGGEPLTPDVVEAFFARVPSLVRNQYGPTEVTIDVTERICRPDDPPRASIPLGRPIDNCDVLVLSRDLQLVPAGVVGELSLGGPGVARGYLDRPELTAERFVPHPFPRIPGERLYRTGDLGRHLPDGVLEFLGRIDHQVKVRGFRIELGEIEETLLAHPEVGNGAVLARRGPAGGDARLVAYVVPRGAAAPTPDVLRSFLKRTLPDHMLPEAFVFLDVLPLTPSGKLDRNALPEPARDAAKAGSARPPQDELELALVQIWEELLGMAPVGTDEDFFALGGHSLLALRLLGAIEARLGRKIALSSLLSASTVAGIAALLRQEGGTPRRSVLVSLQPRGERPPLFLVHPVGGNVLCYARLAREGGLEGPVYGLQTPASADLPAAWTVETMAALYLEALREVQPAGPYRLAGWSLGGVVAFEMARQLEARGEKAALVAMIDVAPPGFWRREAGPGNLLARFAHDLQGLGGPDLPASLEGATPEVRELHAMFVANHGALAAYEPRPYGGRLILIRAEATAAAHEGEGFEAWQDLAGAGAEIHVLPGDHYSLLRPPAVSALSGQLERSLRQALP
ncbi:MAG TPA: amino acid adenylation domain-containing protein [Thermoanaerobaculia bacterium]|nr:amino acid adenylation domain-containing protein [Thermoanaerobaculia bacterium]